MILVIIDFFPQQGVSIPDIKFEVESNKSFGWGDQLFKISEIPGEIRYFPLRHIKQIIIRETDEKDT